MKNLRFAASPLTALIAVLAGIPLTAQFPPRRLIAAGPFRSPTDTRLVADVDGDGLADIVGFLPDGVYVALNLGNLRFRDATRWIQQFGAGWDSDRSPRLVADVNGDGRADIIGFAAEGVWVSLSKTGGLGMSGGFAGPVKWLDGMVNTAGWPSNATAPRVAGDVNGDGKADIVGVAGDGVYVALAKADATGFASPAKWSAQFGYGAGWISNETTPRTVADVNGDGKADVVGFASDGVYVALSTGTGFSGFSRWIALFGSNAGEWLTQDQFPRVVADVNGDRKADVVGFAGDGVYVSLSTGASFAAPSKWNDTFGLRTGWPSQNTVPRVAVDITGDGKADIVGFDTNGVRGSASTGSAFAAARSWDQAFSLNEAYIKELFTELNLRRAAGPGPGAVCYASPAYPLKWNRGLEQSAYRHSFDMIGNGRLAAILSSQSGDLFVGSDGSDIKHRIEAVSCTPSGEIAIYKNSTATPPAKDVIKLLLEQSADCLKVFNTNSDSVGISATYGGQSTFITMDFGTGCPAASTPAP